MTQEIDSIETLLREDRNFCVPIKGKLDSEISSWLSETNQFSNINKRKNTIPSKKLPKIETIEKPKPLLQSNNEEYKNKTSSIQELFSKVSGRVAGNIETNKKFEQLGFSELKPVFHPAKYDTFMKKVKIRSTSLIDVDPNFSHFGCSISEENQINGISKDKFNIYTSSYYNKFFNDGPIYKQYESNPKNFQSSIKNFEYSKFSNRPQKTEFKLPQLRSRSSITNFAVVNSNVLNSHRLISLSSSLK